MISVGSKEDRARSEEEVRRAKGATLLLLDGQAEMGVVMLLCSQDLYGGQGVRHCRCRAQSLPR
jgi:hypothetical protein